MKRLFVVALFAACMALPAQETRREVSHATGNPAVDSKPNSPDVPDVFAVSGHLERIVVLRFKFGSDLLAGLQKMVAQEKIKNAVILSAFGSVRGYQVHMVSNRDMPEKLLFVKNPTAPADIIGMSGMVRTVVFIRTSRWSMETRLSAAISNRRRLFSPSPS